MKMSSTSNNVGIERAVLQWVVTDPHYELVYFTDAPQAQRWSERRLHSFTLRFCFADGGFIRAMHKETPILVYFMRNGCAQRSLERLDMRGIASGEYGRLQRTIRAIQAPGVVKGSTSTVFTLRAHERGVDYDLPVPLDPDDGVLRVRGAHARDVLAARESG